MRKPAVTRHLRPSERGLPDLVLPDHGKCGNQPRRRGDWPSLPSLESCDYTPQEDQFIRAVSHFRSVNKIGCPTLRQLLWVVRKLGYRQQPDDEQKGD